MCFSATASFSVAAVTAGIGVAALRHVTQPRELPLAAVPLLFAIQQAIEGALWLRLGGAGGIGSVSGLATGFLIFAEVVWPAYAALAVLVIEPDRRRRQLLIALAAGGGLLSLMLLVGVLGDPPAVAIRGRSIQYASEVNALSWQQVPYLVLTCAPLLLSSHRAVQAFGGVVLAGFAASAYAYAATFISVWCFFAAAGSVLLYFHFRRAALAVPLLHH